ncbi:MAG: response regulator [Desulfobacteraceae bacterium]|nr:response regulator [Desulfobacteraceae bacterium]
MKRVNVFVDNHDLESKGTFRTLLITIIPAIALPIVGTLLIVRFLPDWTWFSLPLHSALEVAGAAFGMILALIILFVKQRALTSRKMWVACALISMPVLDIFHGCVPPGVSFVWLHSMAILAGCFFFALVWFPEREISRETARATAGAVLITAVLLGILSVLFPESLPAMMVDGNYSPAAGVINLLGGGLTIFAALNFGIHYARHGNKEDRLFLILCLLFGMAGLMFFWSSAWEGDWWFWHILRVSAYLFAFWLSLMFYHSSEKEAEIALKQQTLSLQRLASEFETIMDSIPGLVFYKDKENRYLRVNQYVADAHKLTKKELEGKSLFDLYPPDMAQAYLDDDLGVIHSRKAKLNIDEPWQTETGLRWVSTSKIPFINENDEAVGVIGVSMDVTERKQAEEALARKSKLTSAINKVFREAITCETEEEIAKTALRVAEELTGSKFGFIGEINAAGLMDCIAISNPAWEACDIVVSDAKNFIKNMPLRGIDRTALKEGKSRIVNADQIAMHPDRVGIPPGHPPITCFMDVPFKREEKTVGMISLANKDGGYTRADQEAIESLSMAFYEVLLRKRMERQVREQTALKAGQAELSDLMRGELPTDVLCRNIITYLCNRLEVPTGLLYLAGEDGNLSLAGSHAYRHKKHLAREYKPGEGLVGQAALEGKDILLAEVPENYFTIESGLGETLPRQIHIKPIIRNGSVKAVIELGTLHEFVEFQYSFLNTVAESIAIAIESAHARETQASLLEQSQRLTEELQTQQEELRAANEELEEQTQLLKESEDRLKTRQEELQVTNEELEEKNDLLDRQKKEVEHARREIAEKAEDLAVAGKYKSEFLANMSHELRSPLNSLLLLAQGLTQNKEGNLTEDQVESARIIHGSGSDLLNLINEILDLSRIEAGRMDLRIGRVRVRDMADSARASFRHLAQEKGLDLNIVVSEKAPVEITSDRKRIEQIIRNLMANAIKFTEKGSVTLTFGRPSPPVDLSKSDLAADKCLSISVDDTGIGIAPKQHKIVFEAFHQVDGGTARKYSGTGLGLSISREIASLLGGEIRLESKPGKGSTFTLYLPIERSQGQKVRSGKMERISREEGRTDIRPIVSHAPIEDDREKLKEDDRVILVIEDDLEFARILCKKCHEKGFKCLVATTGESGLELAGKHLPSAVILDIRLPGMDGWAVLSGLKENTRTRHIPVHIASVEADSVKSFSKGALGHVTKPLSQENMDEIFQRVEEVSTGKPWRLLVVEDNPEIRRSIVELIGNGDVCTDEVENGAQALEALRSGRYNCMVLDLGLPDMSGGELLSRAERDGIELPPVVVHTARDLTREEEMELREHAESIVIKDVRSQERLFDEVSLFLHRVVSRMPEKKQKMIRDLHDTDAFLVGKKVLIVDDDMRTTFAVSKRLSERGMNTLKAENGERALLLLEKEPDVDLVLMDIMMPVMDGYEAIRKIRGQERFKKLPILALTAKAMPEDREKCLQAGASDYLTKPVDEERLISMIRVWLYR